MKNTTLISFVGAKKYDYVRYEFPAPAEENVWESDSTLALLESKKQDWNISNVVIIGTTGSMWSLLLSQSDETSLRDELDAAIGSEETLDVVLDKLGDHLTEKYGVNFYLASHNAVLSDDTVWEISSVYDAIYDEIKDSPSLLIDITHGFRGMPILLFQMIQRHMLDLVGQHVELVYMEQGKGEDGDLVSRVRKLDKFWDVARQTDAINRFKSSYDGSTLVHLLKDCGQYEAAKWIDNFSSIVKAGLVMQFYNAYSNIEIAINSLEDEPAEPWQASVKKLLQEIDASLDSCEMVYDLYLQFARMLRDHNLLTQAVIAIDCAIQTRMAVFVARERHVDEDAYIGNFLVWDGGWDYKLNGKRQGAKNRLRSLLSSKDAAKFDKFYKNGRNIIAHGGGEKWNQQFPQNFFDIENYFSLAEKCFAAIAKEEERLGLS